MVKLKENPSSHSSESEQAQMVENYHLPAAPSTTLRGAARAKVTKALGLLSVSLAERDRAAVTKQLPVCRKDINDCIRVCEAYISADDPENLEANESYQNDILSKYAMALEKANDFLEASKPKPLSQPPSQIPATSPVPSPLEFKIEQMCDLL